MEKRSFDISSAGLHILAMVLMLSDHLWAVGFVESDVFTCLGRLAFPIFAFMTVEGYFHTRSLKKYFLRLLLCALISEIPFNLMVGGGVFYPFHQNVIWTLSLGLACVWLIEKLRQKGKWWLTALIGALVALGGFVLGYVLFLDYFGVGVLSVLVFYLFRRRKWWCLLGQLLCLWYLNGEMLGGYYFALNILGREVEIVRQALAILALLPIWLYKGRQGLHRKWFRWLCYGFYPAHMLALVLIARI